jgi:hypothetical protein
MTRSLALRLSVGCAMLLLHCHERPSGRAGGDGAQPATSDLSPAGEATIHPAADAARDAVASDGAGAYPLDATAPDPELPAALATVSATPKTLQDRRWQVW